eukprot:scaffold731_cov261-Pinguiococcus_pyrenoidosus.AAC.93
MVLALSADGRRVREALTYEGQRRRDVADAGAQGPSYDGRGVGEVLVGLLERLERGVFVLTPLSLDVYEVGQLFTAALERLLFGAELPLPQHAHLPPRASGPLGFRPPRRRVVAARAGASRTPGFITRRHCSESDSACSAKSASFSNGVPSASLARPLRLQISQLSSTRASRCSSASAPQGRSSSDDGDVSCVISKLLIQATLSAFQAQQSAVDTKDQASAPRAVAAD